MSDSLVQISNYTFTGSHLLQLSLMYNKNTEDKNYKREYFVFLTLIPGEKANTLSGRNFNFSNRITLKVELEKLLALGYALEDMAKGTNIIKNFQIYTDATKSQYGGNTSKAVYLKEITSKDGEKVIGIGFRLGQNPPNQFNVSPAMALAIADICKVIAKLGIEKELLKNMDINETNEIPVKIQEIKNTTPIPPPSGKLAPEIAEEFNASLETIF